MVQRVLPRHRRRLVLVLPLLPLLVPPALARPLVLRPWGLLRRQVVLPVDPAVLGVHPEVALVVLGHPVEPGGSAP